MDHATRFTYISNQVSLNAAVTIRGKHDFEQEAWSYGHDILEYQGDNGVYKSKEFQKDLLILGQKMEFSGVGAHHQNGVAE